MSKVGHFRVETESGKTIERTIDVNEDECYRNSIHPHQIITKELRQVLKEQEQEGDPVHFISQRHFWTDDTMGDEDISNIF